MDSFSHIGLPNTKLMKIYGLTIFTPLSEFINIGKNQIEFILGTFWKFHILKDMMLLDFEISNWNRLAYDNILKCPISD